MSTQKNKLISLKDYLSLYMLDHGFVRAVYPNLYAIDNQMYRSSQPSPKQLKILKRK